MLPDLPSLKFELQNRLSQYVRKQAQHQLGIFAEMPRQIMHEGKSMRIWRANGTIEESDLKSASSEVVIKNGDSPILSEQERKKELDRMAEELADQMQENMFGTLNTTLENAGQVINRKGKPFNPEAILDALESIEIEFDDEGQPSQLTMVGNPNMSASIENAFEQLENDPPLKSRYGLLMQKKKDEWRDREAARKLVG